MRSPLLYEAKYPVRCGTPGWKENLVERLSLRGIAVYQDLVDRSQLLELAEELGSVFLHRDGDAEGFTDLSAGRSAEYTQSQFLHTDSAGEEDPPDFLVVHCIRPADRGGYSIMADAQNLCDVLATDYREALEALLDPTVGFVRSGSSTYEGAFLRRLPSGRFYFRFRPDNNDLSPALQSHIRTVVHAVGSIAEHVPLQASSGYIARNDHWLHGRTGWWGRRRALRLLINASDKARLGSLVAERGLSIDVDAIVKGRVT